ncbi:hypothetical protein EPO05_06015 [Patescibacteria group bacterium]|nr:MAG: hypothetical protein EPO05_06015 [Patescibacteria group bacterium]
MRKIVTKLWHGLASVRDYEVEECRKKGEDLIIIHEGKEMVIKNANLPLGQSVTKGINSKFNSKQKYNLIDFKWNPAGSSWIEKPVPPPNPQKELF